MNTLSPSPSMPAAGLCSIQRLVRPLPCPYCGAVGLTWETDCLNGLPNTEGWHCGCLNCECDINPYTRTRWKTEDEAIESWNRRSNK